MNVGMFENVKGHTKFTGTFEVKAGVTNRRDLKTYVSKYLLERGFKLLSFNRVAKVPQELAGIRLDYSVTVQRIPETMRRNKPVTRGGRPIAGRSTKKALTARVRELRNG